VERSRYDDLSMQVAWQEVVRRLQPANGTIEIINWVGGDPTFEWRMHVFDAYTELPRIISFQQRCSIYTVREAKLDQPDKCPIVRWFHRVLRDFFLHEADEHFRVDGVVIFYPHNAETRLPGVMY
jgi:hypothetical protein